MQESNSHANQLTLLTANLQLMLFAGCCDDYDFTF